MGVREGGRGGWEWREGGRGGERMVEGGTDCVSSLVVAIISEEGV